MLLDHDHSGLALMDIFFTESLWLRIPSLPLKVHLPDLSISIKSLETVFDNFFLLGPGAVYFADLTS